ncbi:MAG TPA: site-specific integrase [Tepidisphaeraceae bacterium]|jgi:integrase
MPKQRKYQEIRCRFFRWKLSQRNGIYYADGRSNNGAVPLGRYSLEATTEDEALNALTQLDALKAVESKRTSRSTLTEDQSLALPLKEGAQAYMTHVGGPAVMGGAGKSTVKRYRAVFDKFIRYASSQGVDDWRAAGKPVLQGYGCWLDDEGYEYATEYLELTTIKQAINWMIEEKLIPASCKLSLPLKKPVGTTTYRYTPGEVAAMVERCRKTLELNWLGDVVLALTHTGLRISELANLRWSDLDEGLTRISLVDESRTGTSVHRAVARTTKTHRDRSLPIHPRLREVLEKLPRLKDNRVFHGPNGGVLKPDTLRIILIRDVLTPLSKQFQAQATKQGLIDGRLHSFRHYFVSAAASSGKVDADTIISWLGHRDSRMVRHYFHIFEERATAQMQAIEFVTVPSAALADAAVTKPKTETAEAKTKARKTA